MFMNFLIHSTTLTVFGMIFHAFAPKSKIEKFYVYAQERNNIMITTAPIYNSTACK